MSQYLKLFGTLQACFQKVNVARFPRSHNSHADSLAILASFLDECVPRMISKELLMRLSIKHHPVVALASASDLVISFLADG